MAGIGDGEIETGFEQGSVILTSISCEDYCFTAGKFVRKTSYLILYTPSFETSLVGPVMNY